MIDKLTKEQEVDVAVFYRKFRDIGCNTDEADKSVKSEISRFYKMMDKSSPNFIWVDSPWEANVVFSAMASGKEFPVLDVAIDRSIENDEMIPRSIIEDVAEKVRIEKFGMISGNVNAYWLCYFEYARKSLNFKFDYGDYDSDILDVWNRLVEKCGFFYCEENYVVVCNRPKELHFNDANELHCEDGPAVSFRRGTECDIYSINGVVVPEFVVMSPETITIDMVKSEENVEIKRVMMERMGIEKYLEDSKATLVDADTTFVDTLGSDKTVPRALMEDYEGRRFLVASDGSTKRVYFMEVPKECNTCVEASNALSGDISEEDIVAVG